MQNLLSGTVRNYLPTNMADLTSALSQVNSQYSSLSSFMQAAQQANAVLTPQQLAALPPDQQARIFGWRAAIAMLQGITSSALSNSSNRFAAIQQLITALGAAPDQKSVLDLQARIGAEAGMLQNEQTKLQSLYQAAQGQQWANSQQDREAVNRRSRPVRRALRAHALTRPGIHRRAQWDSSRPFPLGWTGS